MQRNVDRNRFAQQKPPKDTWRTPQAAYRNPPVISFTPVYSAAHREEPKGDFDERVDAAFRTLNTAYRRVGPEPIVAAGLPLAVQGIAYVFHEDARFEMNKQEGAATLQRPYEVPPAVMQDAATSPYIGTGAILLLAAAGAGIANLLKGPDSTSRRFLREIGYAAQELGYVAMGGIGSAIRRK